MASASKTETIVDLVDGLPRLRVYDEEISSYEENYFVSTLPVADKNTYIGVEVETENVRVWHGDHSPYWKMTEDGSLRNSGREFVSIPIKAYRVENALKTLFERQINEDIDFSERTSIHIHMNVRTLTLEQLKAMVLLYLLFEKCLFRYVDKERYNNIFCVPLVETDFGRHLLTLFHENRLSIQWTKYTALNLLPIFEKGTIEFRHLHGTKNIEEIIGWINLILCLKKMALRNEPKVIWEKIETLNTLSQYHAFASEVFGEFITHLDSSTLEKDIAKCCTYIKSKCFSNPWTQQLANSIDKTSKLYKWSFYGRLSKNSPLTEDTNFFDEPEDVEENEILNRATTVNNSPWFSQPIRTTTRTTGVSGQQGQVVRPRVAGSRVEQILSSMRETPTTLTAQTGDTPVTWDTAGINEMLTRELSRGRR